LRETEHEGVLYYLVLEYPLEILNRSISWKLFPALIAGLIICIVGVLIAVPTLTENSIKRNAAVSVVFPRKSGPPL
jgi:hypothetical protein